MVRAHVCVLVGLGLMLAAASTQARQLELSVENRLGGTDNVFQVAKESPATPKEDGFWELAPRLVVRDDQDELSYDFRYQPSFEKYFKTSNVDGWDQNARGLFDWRVTPRDSVRLSGSFVSSRRVRAEFVDGGAASNPIFDASDRQRVKRGQSRAFYSHHFTPLLSGRLDYSLDDLDYSGRTLSDTRSHTGTVGLNYALNPLTTIGTALSMRFRDSRINQTLSPSPFVPPVETRNTTRTVDLSFSLQRQLTKSINLSVQAGPSFINTEQDRQLPTVPTEKSHTNNNSVFAVVSANKTWRKGQLGMAYSRFESGGGNSINSSIVDDVSVAANYRFNRQWAVSVDGSWNQRKDLASDLTLGQNQKLTQYRVIGTVTRNLFPRVNLLARISYRLQRQDRFPNDAETETLTGWLALQYNFDPIVF